MVSAPSRERPTTEQPVTGTPVLDTQLLRITLIYLPVCAIHTLPWCSQEAKIPEEKKIIIILRVRNTLAPTLISTTGSGRGRNDFSNTFASPGKVVSVVFSC